MRSEPPPLDALERPDELALEFPIRPVSFDCLWVADGENDVFLIAVTASIDGLAHD